MQAGDFITDAVVPITTSRRTGRTILAAAGGVRPRHGRNFERTVPDDSPNAGRSLSSTQHETRYPLSGNLRSYACLRAGQPAKIVPRLFFCRPNAMKRGQPENPSTRQGCATHENLGPEEATKERGPRISGWSTPEAQRVACGFGGGPYTPKDSSKKQEKTGRSPGQQPAAPADARSLRECRRSLSC